MACADHVPRNCYMGGMAMDEVTEMPDQKCVHPNRSGDRYSNYSGVCVGGTSSNASRAMLCDPEGLSGIYVSKSVLDSKVAHARLCTCLVGAGYTDITQLGVLCTCKRC